MPPYEQTGAKLRALYAGEGGTPAAFAHKVADYSISRPDYPDALFQELKRLCPTTPSTRVADVGAGTGLLTRGLRESGYMTIAVEPNPEMRQESDRLLGGLPGYTSVAGCAEALPLPDCSVQLITAAQAFHWFDVERARREFRRVLSPGGHVALIWNDRVREDPLHVALDGLFQRLGGAKRSALLAHEDRSEVPRFFDGNMPEEFSYPHAHRLDSAGLLSLVFSRSYMPARASSEGQKTAEQVLQVFQRFSRDGRVEVRYRTVAIIGRLM